MSKPGVVDLHDFVQSTIIEIVDGIRGANRQLGGGEPANFFKGLAVSGTLHHIEFDIAVTASSAGDHKAQVGVLSALVGLGGSVQAGGQTSDEAATRVKFKVPIRLPHLPHFTE